MRVITLNEESFKEACACLERKVHEGGYYPDIVVGIARGGVYVAECFATGTTYSVVCQRVGTSMKKGMVSAVLKRLPRWINSSLRCLESCYLEFCDRFRQPDLRKPDVAAALSLKLKEGGHRVLVVDDAVDSGVTLQSVLCVLRKISSNNDIRSASLTVTRKSPWVMPDYYLYHDRTLLRFPWSEDRK